MSASRPWLETSGHEGKKPAGRPTNYNNTTGFTNNHPSEESQRHTTTLPRNNTAHKSQQETQQRGLKLGKLIRTVETFVNGTSGLSKEAASTANARRAS